MGRRKHKRSGGHQSAGRHLPVASASKVDWSSNWLLNGIAATLAAATIVWLAFKPYFGSYRLVGDDFSLVLHSSKPYVGPFGFVKWFTEGYSNYFMNYPDWPSQGFTFSRPVANLSFYVQSWFVPALGDSAYLLTGVLVVVGAVPLSMVAVRRYTNMPAWMAGLFGIAVALSPVWYQSLWTGSFATNSLATIFVLAALVVLDPRRSPLSNRRLAVCVALLMLAAWSHETALVAPFVCVALLYAMARERPRATQVALLLTPVLVVGIRQVLIGMQSNYASDFGAGLDGLSRVKHAVLGMVFPFNDQVFRIAASSMPPVDAILFYLGIALNIAALMTIGILLRARAPWRAVALVLAMLMSMAPLLWSLGDPRFGGFTLVVSSIAMLYLTAGHKRVRAALVVAVLCWHAALFVHIVANQAARSADYAQEVGSFYDYVVAAIDEHEPATVVLVNDMYGAWGSRAMLELAAWPRQDVTVIVLNHLQGFPNPDAAMNISSAGGSVVIENRLARGQWIDSLGNKANLEKPNQGFVYSPITDMGGTSSFAAARPLGEGVTLVVGVDPRDGGFIEPRVLGTRER